MTMQQELAKLKKGEISPVYLLLGTESYLSDVFLRTLKKQVLLEEDDEMNYIRYDMETKPVSLAVAEAQTIPFFGDKRLVQMDHPYFLTGERNRSGVAHDIEELSAYISSPLDSTVMVIYADYEKLDNRKKIVKLLKKQAVTIELMPLKEQELKNYVRQSLEASGYVITPEALERLVVLSNMQLSKVMQELDKLCLYALGDKKITKPMVESMVPKSLEQNIFEMVEYVMKKQSDKSLSLHQELLLQGEDSIKINAILISHFRLLIQVKIMQTMGYQQANMADVLKIHPYRVKLAQQQTQRFDMEMLMSAYNDLADNDWKMKTGQLDKNLLFELFILKYA